MPPGLSATASSLNPTAQATIIFVRRRARECAVQQRRILGSIAAGLSPADVWLFTSMGFIVHGHPEEAGAPWESAYLPTSSRETRISRGTATMLANGLDLSREAVQWWFDASGEALDPVEAQLWLASPALADDHTRRVLDELQATAGDWIDTAIAIAESDPARLDESPWLSARPHLAWAVESLRKDLHEKYAANSLDGAELWEKHLLGSSATFQPDILTSDWCKWCGKQFSRCPHSRTKGQPAGLKIVPKQTSRSNSPTTCAECHNRARIPGHLYCQACAAARGYAKCKACKKIWLTPSQAKSSKEAILCSKCKRAKSRNSRSSVYYIPAGLPGLGR